MHLIHFFTLKHYPNASQNAAYYIHSGLDYIQNTTSATHPNGSMFTTDLCRKAEKDRKGESEFMWMAGKRKNILGPNRRQVVAHHWTNTETLSNSNAEACLLPEWSGPWCSCSLLTFPLAFCVLFDWVESGRRLRSILLLHSCSHYSFKNMCFHPPPPIFSVTTYHTSTHTSHSHPPRVAEEKRREKCAL